MAIADYERPALTADVAAFRGDLTALELLLVRRGNPPFEGSWALPGGFLDPFEAPEAAARRELAEETGLVLAAGAPFALVGVYGEPGRDPRGWVVSVTFVAHVGAGPSEVSGSDDAAEARWYPVSALPPLAFDHDRVASDALGSIDSLLGAP